jgi:hypothetical protein
MTAVLAGTRVSQCFTSRRAQTEGVVEFSVGEQTCIGCYNGAAKLDPNAAVKIYAESIVFGFTRPTRRSREDTTERGSGAAPEGAATRA